MANETDKDIETATGFMKIAESLMGLAHKMDAARKAGEPVDVFASFQEAMDKIKYPAEDVINADEIE